MKYYSIPVLTLFSLAACTQAAPVEQSRDALWARYSHQSIDKVLLEMGTPERETRLTDNSRMATYQHSTILDNNSSYERKSGCEVTFMAQSPGYYVENISMQGDALECSLLAQGKTGTARRSYARPAATPYAPSPFHYTY